MGDLGRHRVFRGIGALVGAALLLGCGSIAAVAQKAQTGGASGTSLDSRGRSETKVRELIRKADAREAESGFCTNIGWPPGDMASYRQFLERAATGTNKVNTFRDRKNCQYDEVEAVFRKDGINCVSYTWWACAGGGSCARGAAIACKVKDGWETQNSN